MSGEFRFAPTGEGAAIKEGLPTVAFKGRGRSIGQAFEHRIRLGGRLRLDCGIGDDVRGRGFGFVSWEFRLLGSAAYNTDHCSKTNQQVEQKHRTQFERWFFPITATGDQVLRAEMSGPPDQNCHPSESL